MNIILTAGGKPAPDDPLYAHTQGNYKAFLDIHGKPMIQWVLEALDAAASIDEIYVVGLPEYTPLDARKPLTIIPDHGGMLENIKAGIEEIVHRHPDTGHVLAGSSDIPALTPQMVDWMADQVSLGEQDIYYTVIRREEMEACFPGSSRTYLKLKDMEVCGGDLNAISTSLLKANNALYMRLIDARKSTFRQAALLGYDTLFLVLLHQMSLAETAAQVCKRLGIRGQALLSPYAQLGMDVDKPHQLEIMRKHLAAVKHGHPAAG